MEHGPTRKGFGSKGGFLFRSGEDTNEIIILLEYGDLEKARQFTESQCLKDAMEKAGVTDMPDIYFLEGADRPSARPL